jgi:AraC-like DNA-binding protein
MVRSSGVIGYSALMRQLGVDPRPLLEKHGLPLDLGEDDDVLVSVRAIVNLEEDSAAATGCPDFGLRLAATEDIRVLGPLAAAIQNAGTVGEALDTASRYLFVHSPALKFNVVPRSFLIPGAVELRVETALANLGPDRQVGDQCLGVLHRIATFLAGPGYGLRAVALPHTPIAHPRVYRTFFGVPIHVDQEHGGLHVAPDALARKLPTVNKPLRQMALDYLNAHYADPTQDIATRVRRALASTLSSNRGSKEAVAALLFVHPRTLQRRLGAEGAVFARIRDDVRRQMARRYLSETQIPLAQLASLLGLADQSVLTRCCVRWFGKTPSAMRRADAATAETRARHESPKRRGTRAAPGRG